MKRKILTFITIISLLLSYGCDVKPVDELKTEMQEDALDDVILDVITAPVTTTTAATELIVKSTTELIEEAPALKKPVPNYVENALNQIDTDYEIFYIGMVDLKNPDGYRYIDDFGAFHPACTIKVFIMEYVFLYETDLDRSINGTKLMKLIENMIQISCNYSAGAILNHYGRRNINNWIGENYKNTRLSSDFLGKEHDGQFNAIIVEDIMTFLEKVYKNIDSQPYKTMHEIMLGTTFTRYKIPEGVKDYENVNVANKPGSFFWDSVTSVDHDTAIITEYDENGELILAYALAIFTKSPRDAESFSTARSSIIAISKSIYEQVSAYEKGLT